MPTFCAAFGSFHAKSSSTSFVTVLVTVRVLPFFFTVAFTFSCCLTVSRLGGGWERDQRYSSTQVSEPRHGAGRAAAVAPSFPWSFIGSGMLSDANWADDAGRGGAAAGTASAAAATASSP